MIKKIFILSVLIISAVLPAAGEGIDNGDSRFKKAVKYFYEKKFEMAELLLKETIKTEPENEKAYSYLADIFLQKKKYDEALDLYRKALNINPESGENYFRIGQVYYYKKFGDLSIQNFKKSLELDSSLKFAYYHIGLSSLMLNRNKEDTIYNWEKFIDAAPEDPQRENIRRVIELLKDPSFKIPAEGSDISIEEALLLGGSTLKKLDHRSDDIKAGHESKKTRNKIEEIYLDDDL